MVLVLKSNGVNVSLRNSNIKEFSEVDDLINYVYEHFKDVDSFLIYISDRHLYKLLKSYIVGLKQLKKAIFYCDSLNDLKQAEWQYRKKSAKFDFCLRTEVENRIRNILHADHLNSPQPLDQEYWRRQFADLKQQLQNKQQNLAVETSSTSPQPNVGYNSRNIISLTQQFYCSCRSYILRDPVRVNYVSSRLSEHPVFSITNALSFRYEHPVFFLPSGVRNEKVIRFIPYPPLELTFCSSHWCKSCAENCTG